ncbi:MAG: hypothetical protein JO362_12060 [Streptomycetaceae bacterium]|nr:hypothetical protein [Streptomycetaceae bacterium]
MIPAGTDCRYTHFDKMAERYKVDRTTAHRWSQEEGFPEVLHTAGQGEKQIYDEDAVDAWVRENHFGAWSQQDKKLSFDLPAGGPRDLLTLSRIGKLEGRVLRREPTPVKTLRTYISREILPKADRTPEDGRRPHVTEPMWFRETAYAYICRPRRVKRSTGEGQAKTEGAAALASEEQLLDLELPAGEDTDLLTVEQIGALDGKARGWGKPTAASTLKKLRSQGVLPKPDRLPGDGGDPAVEEPMWFRETAYRFIRRPGRLGARARADTSAEPPKARGTEGQLRDVKLPGGKDADLLTLQQIGVLDGKARGRGKATTVSTMRTYLYNGLLDKPDRTPDDGLEPAVDEPMWFRSTAYRFIRRPGQLGGARR